jgi:HprK-related kinase A
MTLGQLSAGDLARRLAGPGLGLRTGPFNVRIRTHLPQVSAALGLLYAQHPLTGDDAFCDFTLDLGPPSTLRHWLRPQVQVRYEHTPLFEPLPQDQAFALLEWTMNWWIAGNANQYLLLHAAVIERDGFAAILPAPPGSGKSTLCAGLVHRGWRLLSDEMAMIALDCGDLHGLARPISLKNASLQVMRDFVPGAVFGAAAHDTAKGTVAHLMPKPEDVLRMHETARPRWVVFPRYERDAEATLAPRPKADAMMELGRNAFNYAVLGREGFEALAGVIDASDAYDFRYSRLDDAVRVFDDLIRRA